MHTDDSLLKYDQTQLYDGYLKKKIKKFHLWKAKLQKSDHVSKVSFKKLYLEIRSNHELAVLDLTSPNVTGNYLVTIWKKNRCV